MPTKLWPSLRASSCASITTCEHAGNQREEGSERTKLAFQGPPRRPEGGESTHLDRLGQSGNWTACN